MTFEALYFLLIVITEYNLSILLLKLNDISSKLYLKKY